MFFQQQRGDLDNMEQRERYFLELALNLTSTTGSRDRFDRLLAIFVKALSCDAACLFRKEGEVLIPMSAHGLSREILYRNFPLAEHPRLKAIVSKEKPFVFPHNSDLNDPFDGLVAADRSATLDIHSCLGCPLIVEGEVLGVLTADSLKPHQFDKVDYELLAMMAALAGATLRTSLLIERLEQNVVEQQSLNQTLIKATSSQKDYELLGASPEIARVRAEIDIVGPSDLSILITGETGTGKELVARQLHQKSARSSRPLIYVNCAALPESLAESELFGHKKGAFTGATQDRIGKFELADGGTIFLDEMGELPLSIQPKLLRVLQEGEIQRVGSDVMKRVDLRILAATNRELLKEIENGRFRADLYHRLNSYPIAIAPLRERRGDIEILASYFSEKLQKKFGTPPIRIDDAAKDLLDKAYWPGNVRELKNVLSRAILDAFHRSRSSKKSKVLLLTTGDLGPLLSNDYLSLKPESVPKERRLNAQNLKEATRDFQRSLILETLHQNEKNWSQTALTLGMDRSNLHHLAKRLGLL